MSAVRMQDISSVTYWALALEYTAQEASQLCQLRRSQRWIGIEWQRLYHVEPLGRAPRAWGCHLWR